MRKASIFVLILIPLLEGCFLNVDGPQSPPIEMVNSIQWSSDGSMLVAFRTKPYDSAGGSYIHSYVDVYNRSGTRVSSTAINSAYNDPIAVTDDGQHFVYYYDGQNNVGIQVNQGSLRFGTIEDTARQTVGAIPDSS